MAKLHQNPLFRRTLQEIADYFGVERHAASEWAKRGDFPGEAGRYSVAAIGKWLEDRGLGPWRKNGKTDGESPHYRLARLKGDRQELAIAREKGELVEFDEVRRFLVRLGGEAAAILDQFPDLVLSQLPDAPPGKRAWKDYRSRCRDEAMALGNEVKQRFEDMLAGLAGAEEESGDDGRI
jgi:hypothetical protein